MPIVRESKVEETLEQLRLNATEYETTIAEKRDLTKILRDQIEKVLAEKEALVAEIRNSRSGNLELEEQIETIGKENINLENILNIANNKLNDEEQKGMNEQKKRKEIDQKIDQLKKAMQNSDLIKRKCEAERISLENQIKSLKEEITQQDETITRIIKEKKNHEELIKKLEDNINDEDENGKRGDLLKNKLKRELDECEERFDNEKRSKDDIDKVLFLFIYYLFIIY